MDKLNVNKKDKYDDKIFRGGLEHYRTPKIRCKRRVGNLRNGKLLRGYVGSV